MTATTLIYETDVTRTWGGTAPADGSARLTAAYRTLLDGRSRVSWTEHLRLIRLLGSGGQGVVYLSERRGCDQFTLPVALKIFSPDPFPDDAAYEESMARIAQVSARVATIAHDNLLDVHNWFERDRIRIMEMEWVDGYDLGRLLTNRMYQLLEQRVQPRRWEYLNTVVVTAGIRQPRLKPGVAVAVVRDCLAALAALHRGGVVHGDVKPSNIMLKRTGNAKMVDIGSALLMHDPPPRRTITPLYAAPEVLESNGEIVSPRSDLESLGYVLVEMLSGQNPFHEHRDGRALLEAKRFLPQKLPSVLPPEYIKSDTLMNFIRRLIAPDPNKRFESAEEADLSPAGAAAFLRQLVKGDLASEYATEIRLWLADLHGLENQPPSD